jgi:hypothetical protein
MRLHGAQNAPFWALTAFLGVPLPFSASSTSSRTRLFSISTLAFFLISVAPLEREALGGRHPERGQSVLASFPLWNSNLSQQGE